MNIGLIIIKSNFKGKERDLMKVLRIKSNGKFRSIPIDEVLSSGFPDIAIGFLGGNTVIINHSIPYNCTPLLYKYSDLDENLMKISESSEVLCTYVHSISGVYGHALYLKGEKVKCRAYQENKIERNEIMKGVPNIYENIDSPDEETYYDNFVKVFSGHSIDELLWENNLELSKVELENE